MEKITLDIILEKKQHLHILNTLAKHDPLRLTLHELTYLLTDKSNMYQMSLLQKKIGYSRKNIFKTRQRIYDCLNDLKRLNLVKKTRNKYHLNLFELHILIQREKIRNELKEAEEQLRTESKEIENELINQSEEVRRGYEAEFWRIYGKDFLKKYLTEEYYY